MNPNNPEVTASLLVAGGLRVRIPDRQQQQGRSRSDDHGRRSPTSSPEHRRVSFSNSGDMLHGMNSTPHQHNKRSSLPPTTADKYLTYDKYQMSFDNQLKIKRKQKVNRLGSSKSSPCLSSSGGVDTDDTGTAGTGMGGSLGEPTSPSRYRSSSADLTGDNVTGRNSNTAFDPHVALANGIYMSDDAFSDVPTDRPKFPACTGIGGVNGQSDGALSTINTTTAGSGGDSSSGIASRESAAEGDESSSPSLRYGSLMTRLRGLSNASDADGDVEHDEVYEEIPITVSIGKYIYDELFEDRDQVFKDSDVAERNLMKFISVPLSLECLMWFGLLICTDAFLYIFTFLPLRFLAKCFNVVTTYISAATVGHEKANVSRSIWRLFCYDTTCILVIMIACTFLQFFDMSYTYHFIRGQTMIKLYVITAMLEVVERLLCSFGEDSLSSMHNHTQHIRADTGLRNLLQMLVSMGVYTLYVVIHSCFYFIKVATLTVAFNTTDQSFITILVLNNFAEMKAHVFKKFDSLQLFELTCADIAERFQVLLFLICMMVVACAQSGKDASLVEVLWPFVKAGFLMNFSETISDWIKHAYINKFNRLDPNIYDNFARRLRSDLLLNVSSDQQDEPDSAASGRTSSTGGSGSAGVGGASPVSGSSGDSGHHGGGKGVHHEPINTPVGSHNAMRKIGLTHIPLACVFIRYMIVASYMPRTKTMINQCCCWVIQATYHVIAWFGSQEVEVVTCSCRSGSYRSSMTYALIALAVFSVLVCLKVMLGLYLIYHCVIVHNNELTEVKNDTEHQKKSRKQKQRDKHKAL